MILFEQIRTIDKCRIKRKVGHLSLTSEQQEEMFQVCLSVQFCYLYVLKEYVKK